MKSLERGLLLVAVVLVAGQLTGHRQSKAVVQAAMGAAEWPPAATSAKAASSVRMSKLPLRFEANAGQWDPRVRFRACQGGATLFITDEGMIVALTDVMPTRRRPGETPEERKAALKDAKSAAIAIKLVGANASAPRGEQEMVTKSNFILGNDPSTWRTNVPNYAQVRAESCLPGVDVVWHGGANGLEYDLEVAAGVDAREITLDIEAADSLRIDDDGALEIATAAGTLVQRPPRVVQDGRELHARYRVSGARRIALGLEAYDPSTAVLVDPVLAYSTYLGGSSNDLGNSLAVDASGNAYVAGSTYSTSTNNFPTTTGAYQTTFGGGTQDVFVTKLNAAGTALVYSTYLGGSGIDYGLGIAVDSSGNAYVTGFTSGGFPTTAGAFQTTFGGVNDAFVAKLNPAGSALVYSTYLGGSAGDQGNGIAVDASGSAYVVGSTGGSFPTTTGAYQTAIGGNVDAFVAKLGVAGSALVYSTYLGGTGGDYGKAIALDSSDSSYVTGATNGGFPIKTGAYQTLYGGGGDAFVAKLNTSGSTLSYSSYLGGNGGEVGLGIAVDANDNAYATGYTTGGFPTTAGAFQTAYGGGGWDAFVAKLNAMGSALSYSSYLGGSSTDSGYGIALDSSGNAYVTGSTFGSFPTTTDAYTFGGSQDAFVTEFNATGSTLSYSSYLGGSGQDQGCGIAVNSNGGVYVAGYTGGGFPTTPGAYQTTMGGVQDAFLAEISDPELANGTACTQAGACASRFCIDGVCCNKACTDQCEACDVTGQVGTCLPVTGTPHGSRAACPSTSTCNASCDGANTTACTYGPNVCASTCSNGTENDTLCDTTGACTVQKSHSCNNLVCADANTCKSKCASNSDCASGFACATDGTCQPSGTCIDDHTLQSADNTTKDCTPYKCAGGACTNPCASVDDCVAPNVCDPTGHCVPPPSGGSSGCSCDTSSASSPWGAAALTLAIASLLRKRRRAA